VHRERLPQLDGGLFLTDGGIETTLIFLEGLKLPDFAAFTLLHTAEGEATLGKYFDTYAALAKRFETGLILESATWRASPDWASKLGYDRDALTEANRKAIRLLENVRDKFDTPSTPVVISGCLGPRGDGYVPDRAMSADVASSAVRPALVKSKAPLMTLSLNRCSAAAMCRASSRADLAAGSGR